MTSTFSTNKGLEEPASGDYVNAWATPVNANWTAIDVALGGTTTISVTGNSTLTTTLTQTQYRPPNIEFTGTLSTNLNYQIPTGVGGMWSVNNATTGLFFLGFSIAAGNTLILAPGRTLIVSNGTVVSVATPKPTQGGTYTPIFESGSVQVAGPTGVPAGYGDFQWGFLLPNASGIPSSGLLVGGAGKTQVVHITDAQVTGLKGITVIRTAGDADSTPGNPGLDGGGDLLDFAGASLNGPGGAAKYQGGTSVNSIAGDATLQGGNATGTSPNAQAGNAVLSSGVVGMKCGIGVILSANVPPGASGAVVIRHQFGTAGGTVLVLDEFIDGSKFLYPLAAFPSVNRGGSGIVGQVESSNGPGQPTSWVGGRSTSSPGYEILPGGTILQWGGVTTPTGPVTVDFNITFAMKFPTVCFGVFPCSNRSVAVNGQAANGSNFASSITTTGAVITIDTGPSGTISNWFAIGR